MKVPMMAKIVICPDVFERCGNPWGPNPDQPGRIERPRPSKKREFGDISEAPRTRPVNLRTIERAAWERLTRVAPDTSPVAKRVEIGVKRAEVDPWDPAELAKSAERLRRDHQKAVEDAKRR